MFNSKSGNWEYDLYCRLDQELVLNASVKSEYVSEINWCYRLGFIDETARDTLLEYLDYIEAKISKNLQIRHELNIKEIERKQRELRLKKDERDEIKSLFRGMK